MNTLSKVYSKLNSKTELATHKVDLALIDSLESELNSVSKEYNKQQNNAKTSISELKKISSSLKKLDAKFMDWLINFNDAEEQAKELGVKLPSNILKAEKEITTNMNDAKTLASILSKINI